MLTQLLVFTDVQGNVLFNLKNKHLALFKSFKAEAPNGTVLFKVKGHFSGKSPIPFFFKVFLLTIHSLVLKVHGPLHQRSRRQTGRA